MAFFISHVISTRDSHISPRTEGSPVAKKRSIRASLSAGEIEFLINVSLRLISGVSGWYDMWYEKCHIIIYNKVTGWKLYCEDKPMKVTGWKLYWEDKPMKFTQRKLYCEDKPMKVTGRNLYWEDKPMKVTGQKLYWEDKPMKVTGQPLYWEDKPMKVSGQKLY